MALNRLADVVSMSEAHFKNLSLKDKKQAIRTIAKGYNRNLDRIRAEFGDMESVPATRRMYHYVQQLRQQGKWGPEGTPQDRFSVRGLSEEQLEGQFSLAKRLSTWKTSSLRGARKAAANRALRTDAIIYMTDEDKIAGKPDPNWYSHLPREKQREFWKLYRRLEEDEDISGVVYRKGSEELIQDIYITLTGRAEITVDELFTAMKSRYYFGTGEITADTIGADSDDDYNLDAIRDWYNS